MEQAVVETSDVAESAETEPVEDEGSGQQKEDSVKLKPISSSDSPAMKEAKRLLRVKIDGEDQDVDEDEVKSAYSKVKGADKKFEEAAAMRKEAVSLIEALRIDPMKVLSNPKLGVDVRKVCEQFLLAALEDELMDPKDRELKTTKQKLESYEQKEQRMKEDADQAEADALRDHHKEKYEASFKEALETSGLPKNQHTVRRLAHYMRKAMDKDLDLTPMDVVPLVKEEFLEEQKSMFSGLDGENLLKLLGNDLAKKIRKYDTGRVIKPARVGRDGQPAPSGNREKKVEKITKEAWKDRLDRIKAGLE